MATPPVALPAVSDAQDVHKEFANLFSAKYRLENLRSGLATKRAAGDYSFVRGFATDLATVKDPSDPQQNQSFVDTQLPKFAAWKTADDDLVKRMETLSNIQTMLDRQIAESKKSNSSAMADVVLQQITELEETAKQQEIEAEKYQTFIDKLRKDFHDILPPKAAPPKKAP